MTDGFKDRIQGLCGVVIPEVTGIKIIRKINKRERDGQRESV